MTDNSSWASIEVLVVSPTPTHPQDHGNRKRIFEICRALQRRGAKVHFVHYPSEHDWRYERPARHERMMEEAWDSYQLVPPTRQLHSPPLGLDHDIDEWADVSVTNFLAWACGKRRYDVVIVNYTWMSFALEAIPSSIYKVLDTHDIFGNRRALLAANGISPEFFHTNLEGETRGVGRADLVWAIKDSERVYFERDLGVRDSLTMLHAEPQRGWWTAPPSKDGWLRAGVIGARNNVNRRNLEDFLSVALPIITKYMAPVKIVIAGGCSDDFRTWTHPNVEVMGRVNNVEDFYRSVDVVIAPMQFSTGLKIKVSEALASGAPVIAHSHAMEGYPTRESRHQLQSFEAIALELSTLSFDRSTLKTLASRSGVVCVKIQEAVDVAISATRSRIVEKLSKKICLIAPIAALDANSLLYDHFHAAVDYLRFTAAIEIFLIGKPSKWDTDVLRRYDLQHSVFVAPALHAALGAKAPETWTPIELSDLLSARGYARAYVMADCSEALLFGTGNLKQAFVRHDAIEIDGGDPDKLIDLLRSALETVVVGLSPLHISRWNGEVGIAKVVYAPFRRNSRFERLAIARETGAQDDIFIIGAPKDIVVQALVSICNRFGATARILDLGDAATVRSIVRAPAQHDPLAGLARAKLLIDLGPGSPLAQTLCEAAAREGVPCAMAARGTSAFGLLQFPHALRFASVAQLLRLVAQSLVNPTAHEALNSTSGRVIKARTTNDAGWTVLWRLVSSGDVSSARPPAAKALELEPAATLFGSTYSAIAAAITSAKSPKPAGFDRVILNQYLLRDKYTHIDVTVVNLVGRFQTWPAVRFKAAIDAGVPQLEFRRHREWPDILSSAIAFKPDPNGDVLQLDKNALIKLLRERTGSNDVDFITTLIAALLEIYRFAIDAIVLSDADQEMWRETLSTLTHSIGLDLEDVA